MTRNQNRPRTRHPVRPRDGARPRRAAPRPPTSSGRGAAAKEPTAPTGAKEHCLLPRGAAAGLPAAPRAAIVHESTRLSATDISALASMKNVAKCDTWCELQNPANHRVFERKLRPRPSGRGHACLGVTPKDAPTQPGEDAAFGSPCRRARWAEVGATGVPCRAQHKVGDQRCHGAAPRPAAGETALRTLRIPQRSSLGPRPQVRRDYPPNLSI